MDKKITIVMTYWNRKKQLINTLKSIESRENLKIIIVDDASTDGDDITFLENDYIKVITLKNKTWINPCIAWNTGFAAVTDSDIVIMQNAECMHMDDIVGYTEDNCVDGAYLSFSALSIDKENTQKLLDCESPWRVVIPIMKLNQKPQSVGGNGWYNHPVYNPEGYNFCCAITYKDLYDIGGFDERFYNGLGYDDNELIWRIKKKGMDVQIIKYPFVAHLHHGLFQPGHVGTLMSINLAKFEQIKRGNEYDVKKYNNIFK